MFCIQTDSSEANFNYCNMCVLFVLILLFDSFLRQGPIFHNGLYSSLVTIGHRPPCNCCVQDERQTLCRWNVTFLNLRKNLMHSRLTHKKKLFLYDCAMRVFYYSWTYCECFFTFLTPINMKTCAGPVSHNANKWRLGILFSALRYVAVLKITEKIYSNTLIFSSFFNDFILLILTGIS